MRKAFIIILLILPLSSIIFLSRSPLIFYKILNLNLNSTNKFSTKVCKKLQTALEKETRGISDNISLTVVNEYGQIIADLYGKRPLIPASNQKLITTGIALSKLNINYRISTVLYKSGKNQFHLVGNGDPDLNLDHIDKFIEAILNSIKYKDTHYISLNIYETNKNNWTPSSWNRFDKKEIYGAPITKIAINSNANDKAISDPSHYLVTYLRRKLYNNGYKLNHKIINKKYINTKADKMILEVRSANLLSLLTLANSESHNFTSEILLRNAFNDWDIKNLEKRTDSWLKSSYLPIEGFAFADASGLSRANKLTTFGLSSFLWYINQQYFSKYYFSSLSLYGIRGTLKESPYVSELYGKFLGKTGTLKGIRSISGKLTYKEKPYFISIIANKIGNDDEYVLRLLSLIAKNSKCSNS
tara:strand:- start:17988 stop:19232 length:1245 start_codon:yes stop_codon:yes gene_type:complete